MDVRDTATARALKLRRYGLSSLETQSERIKRFRLTRMEGLPRLERLEPAPRTSPRTR